ncbi:PEP/pyruvate-binding domain-containing protein, partial [Candidatus Bipolaricaulota bacterium]|nr:PEP/pyruvate-binding domain-containing protein [Candidatus Bipolaricaulota bacterium]
SDHQELIRFPDSVVVTTEAFDEFMARNRLGAVVQEGCTEELSLEQVGRLIEQGTFSEAWRDALRPMLERKTRPLAVRSSSVMEDDTNHSFAGIYPSEFLPNRGPIDLRLDQLLASMKRVYASTFAPNARAYRKRHDLDWREEKMAILIQDMVGSQYSHNLFYPLVGGVAFSHNYYPWSDRLRPEDGIVRLVVGTGTRAVGREYAQVFSPRLPGLSPEGNDVRTIIRYAQETVDVLDMELGRLSQRKLGELDNPLLARVCSIVGPDNTIREPLTSSAMLSSEERFLASFSRLIEGTSIMPFTPLVRDVLRTLEAVLGLAVDIEFAVDFSGPEASAQQTPLFNILQVRPLGSRPEHRRIRTRHIPSERLVLRSHRVLGNGVQRRVRHIILVEPDAYRWDRAYDIARTIGRINNELVDRREPYILMGPGRWASTNPQLGVPGPVQRDLRRHDDRRDVYGRLRARAFVRHAFLCRHGRKRRPVHPVPRRRRRRAPTRPPRTTRARLRGRIREALSRSYGGQRVRRWRAAARVDRASRTLGNPLSGYSNRSSM